MWILSVTIDILRLMVSVIKKVFNLVLGIGILIYDMFTNRQDNENAKK